MTITLNTQLFFIFLVILVAKFIKNHVPVLTISRYTVKSAYINYKSLRSRDCGVLRSLYYIRFWLIG